MVLTNQRHERFAQALAKGKSQTDAYIAAGYSDSRHTRHTASHLATKDTIQIRVAELLGRAAVRAEVSIASVTESLLRIGSKAEKLADSSGLAVARAAQMDIAKLHGLIVDKVQADVTNRDVRPDELDDDALAHIAGAGRDGTAATPGRPN